MRQIFSRPYFVTPHAVRQFQQRVADLPWRDVIDVIQEQLQGPLDVVHDAYFRGRLKAKIVRCTWRGIEYWAVIEPRPTHGEWPAVVTILPPKRRDLEVDCGAAYRAASRSDGL